MRLGLRQTVNLAWHYLTKDGTKQSIDKLKADLIKPIPGLSEEVSDEVIQAERDMFVKSLGIMKGG